jgi:pimeloyl-ACP methyl ester carboxylesterase
MMKEDAVMAAGYEERQVTVKGCNVRYLVGGEGPPVVFVHGGGGPHWWTFQNVFAERTRVYAVELPGYGESTVSEGVRSIYDVADVLAGVVAAAGLERPGLIGESLGGFVSSWAAIRHPGFIGRLLLESPGGLRLPTAKPREQMTPEEVRQALFLYPDRLPPGYGDPSRQPRGFMPHLQDRGGWDDELKARLPEIKVPTLIVNGERDGLLSPDSGRVYRAHIPGAWRICVEDAAHVIHLDQPELFTALASGFFLAGDSKAV